MLRRHFDDVIERLTGYGADGRKALKTMAKRHCYCLIPELTCISSWAEQQLMTSKERVEARIELIS